MLSSILIFRQWISLEHWEHKTKVCQSVNSRKTTKETQHANRFGEVLKSGESVLRHCRPRPLTVPTVLADADYIHLAGCKLNYGTFCGRTIVPYLALFFRRANYVTMGTPHLLIGRYRAIVPHHLFVTPNYSVSIYYLIVSIVTNRNLFLKHFNFYDIEIFSAPLTCFEWKKWMANYISPPIWNRDRSSKL